jgi:hypothetical protein
MYKYTKQKKNENGAVNRPLSEREEERERESAKYCGKGKRT